MPNSTLKLCEYSAQMVLHEKGHPVKESQTWNSRRAFCLTGCQHEFNGKVATNIGNEFHSYGSISIVPTRENVRQQLESCYGAARRAKKSGKVFDTQEGFSITIPATRSPITAKLIAIR